jgi:hypothetical protein
MEAKQKIKEPLTDVPEIMAKKPSTKLLFPVARQPGAVKKDMHFSPGDIPAGMPSSISARKREAMYNVDALQHLGHSSQANSARP